MRYGAPMRPWLLLLLAACDGPADPAPAAPAADAPAPAAPAPAAPAPAPAADALRVVFLGDSLTAGLGLAADDAFPARLGRDLAAAGLPVTVVNAGVSGDTTAGGLRRVDWVLQQAPAVVVVGLGGNDMLRGLPPAETRANLRGIVTRAQAAGAAVLLLGMRANPSLGADYVAAFDPLYPELAAELGVPLVPFLLEGVAGDPALNQADGIHPTAAGQARVAEHVRPALEALVREVSARRGTPR